MRVIGRRYLLLKANRYPHAKAAADNWFLITKAVRWNSIEDIRKSFPDADMVGPLAIFNIKGNHFRLIVRISFAGQRVYIKEFLTHAEYDRKGWMKWL